MARLEYSEHFADDLSRVESSRIEKLVYSVLDSIELFPEFGSKSVPDSIRRDYGTGVRKVAVNPFDLFYTFLPDRDLVRIEALVHQKRVK